MSQESPICQHLYRVRDAQAKEIQALRASLASPTLMPCFFAEIAPAKQYTVRSAKGTQYKRVRRLPNELVQVVVDLMVR